MDLVILDKYNIMKKAIILGAVAILGFVGVTNAQSYVYNNDLVLGSSGPDVVQLQAWLMDNGFNIPSIASGAMVKGYFGAQTQSALISYQKSVGLPAYGFFGPMTRQYLNNSINNNNVAVAFRITRPVGGESWQRGSTQNITWTSPSFAPSFVRATYVDIKLQPSNACSTGQVCIALYRMPYTIATGVSINQNIYSWNVGTYMNPGVVSPPACSGGVVNGVCMSSSNSAPDGQYSIQICQTGTSVCTSSNSNFTIYSNGQTASPISVLSPTGGEVWNIGENRTISWATNNYTGYYGNSYATINQTYDVYLTSEGCAYPMMCASNLTAPQILARYVSGTSYTWSVGTLMANTGVTGRYRIQVCQAGSTTVCGSSNAPFTINSSSYSSTPDINVLSPNGGEVWYMGNSQQVSFNITGDPARVGNNVTAYLVNTNNQQIYLGTFSQGISAGQKTFYVTVPTNLVSGPYKLFVNLNFAGQQQAYDYSDNYFTVSNIYPYGSVCPAGYACTTATQ